MATPLGSAEESYAEQSYAEQSAYNQDYAGGYEHNAEGYAEGQYEGYAEGQYEGYAVGEAATVIPDYNERLGYGTDQGRWLMEQVSAKQDSEGLAKRRGRPVRAYHDIAEANETPTAGGVLGAGVVMERDHDAKRSKGDAAPVDLDLKVIASAVGAIALILLLLLTFIFR